MTLIDDKVPTAGSDPGYACLPVTPSDGVDLKTDGTPCRAIYVGGDGDVSIIPAVGSAEVIFRNAKAGAILPVRAKRVRLTNTSATNLVALF